MDVLRVLRSARIYFDDNVFSRYEDYREIGFAIFLAFLAEY
jgi:hypothetical protein